MRDLEISATDVIFVAGVSIPRNTEASPQGFHDLSQGFSLQPFCVYAYAHAHPQQLRYNAPITLFHDLPVVPMKKKVVLLALITLLILQAAPHPAKLVRFTLVNKSGLPIALRMSGVYWGAFYYLKVEAGDRTFPAERTFTIQPDVYATRLYYLEDWDPIYGYRCASKKRTLTVLGNVKAIVLECDRLPPNFGEPPFTVKYR